MARTEHRASSHYAQHTQNGSHRADTEGNGGAVAKKRHHTVLWTILAVLVVLIAVAGFFGFRFYQQAKQVQQHEQTAITLLSSLEKASSAEDLTQLTDQVPQIQKETATARSIAENGLWNAAAVLPYFGQDVSTVQGMTRVVDDLSQKAIPTYLTTLETLSSADLTSSDGNLNLKPVLEAEKPLTDANKLLAASYKEYTALATPHIEMIKNAYEQGATKLKAVVETTDNITNTMTFMPGFIGDGDTKTYVVASVTPAESRSAGGLVGSLGSVTIKDGKISMGAFYPNKAFIPLGAANKTSEAVAVFQEPLHMSFDIRDQDVIPDFATAATGIQSIWNRSEYSAGSTDGVMQFDPMFLQEVNKICGSFTLSNGVKLTGENTSEYLQNTIYKDVPTAQQDIIFGEVATNAVKNLFSSLTFSKMKQIATILPELAQNRHFQVMSNDAETQKYFAETGYSPAPQMSEENPTVGIYVTQQRGSKMDWYTSRKTTVTRVSTAENGAVTYHVKYALTNTLTDDLASTLPAYIIGNKDKPGKSVEKVLFYAPAGGTLANITVSGNGSGRKPVTYTLLGKKLQMSVASMKPQTGMTYEFDVTTSAKAEADLAVDQTPTVTADTGITYRYNE